MPRYMMAYHGEPRPPESQEEGMEHMYRWKRWLANLGDAVELPGSPLGETAMVGKNGIREDDLVDQMSGFSVIHADDLKAAIAIASDCPYLEIGGELKVAEMKDMGF